MYFFMLVPFFFFNFWLCRVLVVACGISLAARRLLSHCGTRASERVGSVVVVQGLQSAWTETPPLISGNYVFTHQCLSAWMCKSLAFIKDIISLVSFIFFSSWNYTFFFKDLFIICLFYLFLVLGLSCGTQALRCGAWSSLWLWRVGFLFSSSGTQSPGCMGSVVVAWGFQSTWAL